MKTFTLSLVALCAFLAIANSQTTETPPPISAPGIPSAPSYQTTPSAPQIVYDMIPHVAIDPVAQRVASEILPHQYAAWGGVAVIVLSFALGIRRGMKNGLTFWSALVSTLESSNLPAKLPLVALCCLLLLPACSISAVKSLFASPQGSALIVGAENLGIHVALADGLITEGQSVTLTKMGAIIADPSDPTKNRLVKAVAVGLQDEIDRQTLHYGDTVKILPNGKGATIEYAATATVPPSK